MRDPRNEVGEGYFKRGRAYKRESIGDVTQESPQMSWSSFGGVTNCKMTQPKNEWTEFSQSVEDNWSCLE